MSSSSSAPRPEATPSPEPLFRIVGDIVPRRVPFAYRCTLALTAFAMVLLPLVYIALIVATAYGVYLWAIKGGMVFEGGRGGWIQLLIYLAPLFIGATLIAFMIKPFFARPAKRPEALSLDLERYPQLRDLIAAICGKVGAPMPVRVDVDCEVNASASLRRGIWSLGRRDLVLTIGLPLVNGLTTRQLAGVLAHEFGHFAQGAGMAFTYIIRSINNWFGRVVFSRDQWDATLEDWMKGADYRLAIVVGLARGAVWLTRKILHGLMLLGHAIACLQLRQMEYDADYYEVALAGTRDFSTTARELARLGAAGQQTFNSLGELWQTRKLVDDFPRFLQTKRTRIDTELLAKIDKHATESKTGWFDTHPSHADRDQAALRLALNGVLQCEAPATAFFPDLPELSRKATLHYYSAHLGLTVEATALVSTDSAERADASAAAADAARTRLAGEILDMWRPLVWSASDFTPSAELTPSALATGLAVQRSALDQLRPRAVQEQAAYSSTLEHLCYVEHGHTLLSVGAKIKPSAFRLSSSNLDEASAERAEYTKRLTAKADDLKPFENALHAWASLVGRAARSPAVAEQLAAETRDEIIRVTDSLAALAPWFTQFPTWQREFSTLDMMYANHESLKENERFISDLRHRFHVATETPDKALSLVGSAPVPLVGSSGTTPAATILRNALEGVEGPTRHAVVLRIVVQTYFRLVSRLAALGEEVEKSLGSPAPAPAVVTPSS